jgi:hypothetical protein
LTEQGSLSLGGGGHLKLQGGFGAPLIDMGHKGPVKAQVHRGREVPNSKYRVFQKEIYNFERL